MIQDGSMEVRITTSEGKLDINQLRERWRKQLKISSIRHSSFMVGEVQKISPIAEYTREISEKINVEFEHILNAYNKNPKNESILIKATELLKQCINEIRLATVQFNLENKAEIPCQVFQSQISGLFMEYFIFYEFIMREAYSYIFYDQKPNKGKNIHKISESIYNLAKEISVETEIWFHKFKEIKERRNKLAHPETECADFTKDDIVLIIENIDEFLSLCERYPVRV
ncbi:hypothetical protein AB4124_18385 [Paenibacillus sp. 2KB_20]|uniref:hypothetical protein n=1 Tax=Paenibacillus sp. 2KB_20 TaxID=3232977 RepID=UPI003F9D3D9F